MSLRLELNGQTPVRANYVRHQLPSPESAPAFRPLPACVSKTSPHTDHVAASGACRRRQVTAFGAGILAGSVRWNCVAVGTGTGSGTSRGVGMRGHTSDRSLNLLHVATVLEARVFTLRWDHQKLPSLCDHRLSSALQRCRLLLRNRQKGPACIRFATCILCGFVDSAFVVSHGLHYGNEWSVTPIP